VRAAVRGRMATHASSALMSRTIRPAGPRMRRLLELLRFSVAGAASFFVDLVVLVLLKDHTPLPLALDAAIAFAVAALVNFALSRQWVFDAAAKSPSPSADLARYALLVGAGLALTTVAVPLLAGVRVDYRLAKVLASGVVAATNYLLLPRWVFRAPQGSLGS
jgi:putative flippase GtrA